MSEDVMRKHIDLYVNDYLEMGRGKIAVLKLLEVYNAANNTSLFSNDFFVNQSLKPCS